MCSAPSPLTPVAGLEDAERWEARIGIPGSKHIYLGLFNEEREAARMYDAALVSCLPVVFVHTEDQRSSVLLHRNDSVSGSCSLSV